jgi:hypothetical protein
MNEEEDIPLETLARMENLSVRTMNACKTLQLDSLQKILRYQADGGDFKAPAGAGRKVEYELTSLCNRYRDRLSHETLLAKISEEGRLLEWMNALPPDKKDTLHLYVSSEFHRLTPRARHALILRFGKEPDAEDILKGFFSAKINLKSMPNIGDRKAELIEEYIGRIRRFAESLADIDHTKMSTVHAKEVVEGLNKGEAADIDRLMESVVDRNGRILLFRLIDRLVRADFMFGKKESKKWVFLLSFTEMDEREMREIRLRAGIGKEMERQIRQRLIEGKFRDFEFISRFRIQDLHVFGYRREAAFLCIDHDWVKTIQAEDGTRFNIHFMTWFQTMVSEGSHLLIGAPNLWKSRKVLKRRAECRNAWLIRKDLCHAFDFKGFLVMMQETTVAKFDRDTKIELKESMAPFQKRGAPPYNEEVVSVCLAILEKEFGLQPDANGRITFKRNTKRLELLDYVVEALEAFGEPSKATRIVEYINNHHPYVATNVQSVKSKIRRNGNLFIYFGRSSTFGMRKWEEEKENVRGGTIREIAEDYLEKQTEPKHISEITKHVQRYRATNQSSVRHNLEVDQRKRFRHFPGGFVGLSDKLYTDTDRYKKIPGQLFRSSVLKKWDGRMVEDLIRHFIDKYGCKDVQVRSIIEYKVAKGELSLTPEGKLAVY